MKDNAEKRRNTKQRRLIYGAVENRCDHPTAEEICADVQKEDKSISLGTVYRNLGVLSENGEISHVKLSGKDRYDLRTDNHCHILCVICGKVQDAPIPYHPDFDKEVQNSTGFTIARHQTVFEGICPACQQKQEQNKEK